MTAQNVSAYPARLSIDYPARDLDRVSTFLRIIYALPIVIVLALLSEVLFLPCLLMIVFKQKYPRWWFDWNLGLTQFSTRVWSYVALMSDEYPSTDEEQNVHLELDYPDAKEKLNRWLPLVKWFLAIPHLVVLILLGIGAIFAVVGAGFAILFTGRYPRAIFDYVEGVLRWALRVEAYAFLLITDEYPPFSMK